ncbi:hypothetical protein RhiirA5_409345 [Rhizophagus irregularis]|uniref:Uncharacterized protein n=1 Tax=Rhizophagus irregularis TaxID=588596 RepID=A0A2I1DY54_9GLOM|nr:hypothetical protein RhiirA5_409345 [Rhizophagus irregularis]PKY14790.1 hypothetical protein RhiirB3_426871 [Rhizophagus irregularis]
MDKNEFNKILIDELKLLFLRIRNPSDDSLKILLKAIDPTINCVQLKEYIGICKGKFSDFRYNYKNTILKKAQCLEINFRNIALEGFEGLLDEIITENDCRQILASHLSCTHKETFEADHISLNELVIFVKKSLLIGIKSFYIPKLNVGDELKKLDHYTSSVKLQSRYLTNIIYNMNL